MRSELFRVPYELGGVPLFGYGVLVVLWLIGAGVAFWVSRRRAARAGTPLPLSAMAWDGVFALVVAGAIVKLPSFFPEGLPVRAYGVMLVLASVAGCAMAAVRAKRLGIDPDVIFWLATWLVLSGIAGARLFFVIQFWDVAFPGETLFERLQSAMKFTEGGLVVYGGLICATAVYLWRCYAQKLPALAIADLLAPSLAVGLAIGRIGCLLNGCCYGGLCEKPWAVTFPRFHSASQHYSPPYGDQVARGEMHGIRLGSDTSTEKPRVVIGDVRMDSPPAGLEAGAELVAINGMAIESLDQAKAWMLESYQQQTPVRMRMASGAVVDLPAAPIRERSLPVHPTQLYSAINAGLLGWFLWAYYPHRRRDGEVIGLGLTIYPMSRFLLEVIRVDESAVLQTGMTISQNVSVLILLSMAGYWLWMSQLPRYRALEAA